MTRPGGPAEPPGPSAGAALVQEWNSTVRDPDEPVDAWLDDLARRIDAALAGTRAEERKRVISEWALTHTMARDEAWKKILDAATARAKAEGAEEMRRVVENIEAELLLTSDPCDPWVHRNHALRLASDALRALDAGAIRALK